MSRSFRSGAFIKKSASTGRLFAVFLMAAVSLRPVGGRGAESAPQKAMGTAQILRKESHQGQIAALSFDVLQIPVTLMPNDGRLRPLVEIHGHFRRKGWLLFAQDTLLNGVATNPSKFVIYAYLSGRTSEFVLTAKGPAGQLETEEFSVFAPQAQEFRIGTDWGELMVSSGAANLNYFQTGLSGFSAQTSILALHYSTPKSSSRLGGYASLASTFWTLASGPGNYSPQMIEGKVDGTYLVTRDPLQAWQARAVLGMSYYTMLSNGSPFGFANLMSPELGARVFYALNATSRLRGEFRYVLLGSFLSMSERGFDLSLTWSKRLLNLHRFEVGMHLNDFAFIPDENTAIKATLLSLQIGLSI